MNIKYNEINQIPLGEPFICLFSGGKDSSLALSMAAERGQPLAVIHSADLKNNTSFYHNQPINVIEKQAQAMGLPLELIDSTPRSSLFAYKLVRVMKKYSAMGVKTLVAGSTHDKAAVELCQSLCNIVGYTYKCPLWNISADDAMYKIEQKNIQTIITSIDATKLSPAWLGKQYNRTAFETFKKMGIHPLGEYGEFHTTVVNTNIFSQSLRYKYEYKGIDFINIIVDL